MSRIWRSVATKSRFEQREAINEAESNFGMPFCRICYGSQIENMIEPCSCRGTIAHVHKQCLEKWLSEKESKTCELCAHKYNVEVVPKYYLVESINVWLRHELSTKDSFDIILIVVWMFIILGAAAFILPKLHPFEEMSSPKGISFLFALFVIDLLLIIARFFYLMRKSVLDWYAWWKSEKKVHLLLN